jgi:hypothetical protein
MFHPVLPGGSAFFPALFSAGVLHVIFYGAVILYALASAALFYHWVRYNVGLFRTLMVAGVYFAGSFVLLAAAYSAMISI